MDPLAASAARWGIEPRYTDAFGRPVEVDAETLRRLIAALGQRGEAPQAPAAPAPGRAHQPEIFRCGERAWLLTAALFAVRSRRNWGHGDFTDLANLLRVAARAGAAGVGVNPLHALFPDRPQEASPYSPSSRLFLNPLYIDVEAVPDFPGVAAVGAEDAIAQLRDTPLVDYAAVAALKLKALRIAYREFLAAAAPARRQELEAFREARGTPLARFAAFQVLRSRHGLAWRNWPREYRRPKSSMARIRLLAPEEFDFYEYLQWLADGQLAAAHALAGALNLPIGLYLDTALAVSPDGTDAWAEQAHFIDGVTIGAPPDLYNRAGQGWGLAAFHPQALASSDFAAFRAVLRSAMRHAGAVRLDHVLGLNRLYLIPAGFPASRGGYVRYPFDAMLAAAAEESRRCDCLLIGEDLGTVPEGVRDRLAASNVWSYRVMMFERDANGAFLPPESYPADALVTFNTHDLPTFAGWLAGRDLEIKRLRGVDPGESGDERENARRELRAALQGIGIRASSNMRFGEIIRFLARTRARLLAVSLEDAVGAAEQINMPGTVTEYPNWRHRLPVAIEDLEANPVFQEVIGALKEEGWPSRQPVPPRPLDAT